MASDTWESVAVPILEAIAAAERAGTRESFESLVSATGHDEGSVERELRTLIDGRYVDGIDVTDMGGFDYIELRLRERGKRVFGEWPGEEAYRVLVEKVDERIDRESDPQKREGLKTLRDGLVSIGTGAGGSLLAEVLRSLP